MASREVSLPSDAILTCSPRPASPFGRQGDGDNAGLQIQLNVTPPIFCCPLRT